LVRQRHSRFGGARRHFAGLGFCAGQESASNTGQGLAEQGGCHEQSEANELGNAFACLPVFCIVAIVIVKSMALRMAFYLCCTLHFSFVKY
jgi:hypothetical protein